MVAGPTPPTPSFAEGEILWRVISHLSQNYLSLADAELPLGSDHGPGEARGASAMRDLLRLYGNLADASIRKQIEGVRSIRSEPVTRRVPLPGPITFARGLAVHVEMEENYFEGIGWLPARCGAGQVPEPIRLDQLVHRDDHRDA